MTAPKRQQGVALIMVLMITGILGLLMLQIGLTAREHVARAQKLLDRAEATLRLQSRESAMLFSLMTREWSEGKTDQSYANPYAAKWNFRGEAFEIDGAQFHLQDTKGLFPMPQPGEPTGTFERFLEALGIDRIRVERIGKQYADFQEFDRDNLQSRRIPLQSFRELRDVVDLTPAELALLEARATLYPSSDINPQTASDAFLSTRFQGVVLDGIRRLRGSTGINSVTFAKLSESGADDLTVYYPGPALRLDIDLTFGTVSFKRESTLVVRPYDDEPLILWGRRRLNAEETSS